MRPSRIRSTSRAVLFGARLALAAGLVPVAGAARADPLPGAPTPEPAVTAKIEARLAALHFCP